MYEIEVLLKKNPYRGTVCGNGFNPPARNKNGGSTDVRDSLEDDDSSDSKEFQDNADD